MMGPGWPYNGEGLQRKLKRGGARVGTWWSWEGASGGLTREVEYKRIQLHVHSFTIRTC